MARQPSETARNAMNEQLQRQPWYQQYKQRIGMWDRPTNLNSQQKAELTQLAAQHGMQLPKGAVFDDAGNVNIRHGYAGMPTWAKIAIAAAPVIATAGFGAAGMGPMAGMFGAGGGGLGSGVAGTTSALGAGGSMAVPELGIGAIPGLLGHAAIAPSMAPITFGGSGGAGSFISNLLGKIPGKPQAWSDAAKMVSGIGEAEARNRAGRADLTQDYDRLMMEAARNRRTEESDAMRKLAQAGYLARGGSQFKAPIINIRGREIQTPDFGLAPPPASESQKQAAGLLESQMLDRLRSGGYQPQPLSSYADRGKLEKAGSYIGAAVGGLGAAKDIFGF